jgi:predicted DNA-binding protein
MSLEVKRVSAMSTDYILSIMDSKRAVGTTEPIRELSKNIAAYAVELNGTSLTPYLAEVLGNLIEAMQEFLFALDLSDEIRDLQDIQKQSSHNTELKSEALKFTSTVQEFLKRTSKTSAESQQTAPDYNEIEIAYRIFKKVIMHQAATGSIPIFQMDSLLQDANATKRCCRHLSKAQRRLLMVQEALQQNAAGEITPSSVPEATNLAMLQEAKEKLDEKPAP